MFGLGYGLTHLPLREASSPSSSGPTVASTLADFLATNAFAVFSPADTSTDSMSEDRIEVTPVTPDGPLGQYFDRKGASHSIAPSDGFRPLVSATGVITWDGLDDRLNMPPPGTLAPPAAATYLFLIKTTDTAGVAVGDPTLGANYGFRWASTGIDPTGSNGTSYVDGVSYANRSLLGAAVSDGVVHVGEQRGFNATGFTQLAWSGSSIGGLKIAEIFIPLGILNEGQADIVTQRSAGNAYAAALIDYFNL